MRVLIAVDRSPVSHAAASRAVDVLDRPGTLFVLLNVAEWQVVWEGPDGYGSDDRSGECVVAPAGMDELELRALASGLGIPGAEVLVEVGDPSHTIGAVADRLGVDLVVVGRGSRSAWERVVHPSALIGLLRSTDRPVLVMGGTEPAGDESRQR